MENQFNTLAFYKTKVAKSIFLISTMGILASIASCLLCVLLGLYTTTPVSLFIIFMIVGSIEMIGFIVVYRKVFQTEQSLLENYHTLKWSVGAICLINYTFIINLMPSQLMWTTFMFFLLVTALFQDFKMSVSATVMYAVVILIFFMTHSVESLQQIPVRDEMMARILLFLVGISGIILNSYFSGHILANVGQGLMDENTKKLTYIIEKVTHLMDKLRAASNALVCIAQEENASMEEIASVSINIVHDNNYMLEQSQNSQINLGTLREGVGNISDKMQETKRISSELLQMATNNESALNNVLEMHEIINASTEHTLTVTQNLKNKVEEIDNLLQLIKNIANETNLLALNASIEAARAGEGGRGFSVVAEQVKKLSENTAKSLENVNQVIYDFKKDTNQVEVLVTRSTNQMETQNKVTNETIDVIKETLNKLKYSAEKIDYVESLTRTQNEYTGEAVVYNEHVIGSIKEQVVRVDNIAHLVEDNTKAIQEIVIQINGVDEIIDEIYKILE